MGQVFVLYRFRCIGFSFLLFCMKERIERTCCSYITNSTVALASVSSVAHRVRLAQPGSTEIFRCWRPAISFSFRLTFPCDGDDVAEGHGGHFLVFGVVPAASFETFVNLLILAYPRPVHESS